MGSILASAMRHSVGRPAMGMEGGTIDLWSGPPAAVWPAFEKHREAAKTAPTNRADFVEINLTVRHNSRERREK